MAKIGFPSLRPSIQSPGEHVAARGTAPRQHRSPSAPLMGQKRKPEHARFSPMTIISCITAITTAILPTGSCPMWVGYAGPGCCGMAKRFTLCTALSLLPASLLGTGFQQCQQAWISVSLTDLIVILLSPPGV